jgi:coenzyme PQQ precursor peptide PqqA
MAIATSLKASVPNRLLPPIAEATTMKWTTPRVVEFAVGLEINSYARAELNRGPRTKSSISSSRDRATPSPVTGSASL